MSHHEGGLRTRGVFKESNPLSPLISVITVVYNGERHLEQTIMSVIEQEYGNLEYIILDGGSTDGTLDIIKKYDERIDYWLSEPDKGIYDAMNKGIRLATGEIIGIINADDYYLDGAVNKIVETAHREPGAGVFHADMQFERANGITETWHSRQTLSKSDFYHMPINHPTAFVRTEFYKKYGVFDTRYKVAADYELTIRYLFDYHVTFCYVKDALVCMREGGESCNYSFTTYHDVLEILSGRNFSHLIKIRFRIWYLGILFIRSAKRYNIGRYLFSFHNRIKCMLGSAPDVHQ